MDRDLDKWIAENILKLKYVDDPHYTGPFYVDPKDDDNLPIYIDDRKEAWGLPYWNPTQNIEQAFEVLEKIAENSDVRLGNAYQDEDDWWCTIDRKNTGVADTPALAICRAAKKAMEK